MNTKHTPTLLPWTYFVGNACGRGLVRVEAASDSQSAGEHVASLTRGPVSVANANYIVRACNAHADLVAALKRLMWLETSQGVTDDEIETALEAAGNAISKAKGE